jgi:hypothetical protein
MGVSLENRQNKDKPLEVSQGEYTRDCGMSGWSALEFCIMVRRVSSRSGVVGPRSDHTNCTLNDLALSPGARPHFEKHRVIFYAVLKTSNEVPLRLFLVARLQTCVQGAVPSCLR